MRDRPIDKLTTMQKHLVGRCMSAGIITIEDRPIGLSCDLAIVAGELVEVRKHPTKKAAIVYDLHNGKSERLGYVPLEEVHPVNVNGVRYKSIEAVPDLALLLTSRRSGGNWDIGTGTTAVSLRHIAREYNRR